VHRQEDGLDGIADGRHEGPQDLRAGHPVHFGERLGDVGGGERRRGTERRQDPLDLAAEVEDHVGDGRVQHLPRARHVCGAETCSVKSRARIFS